MKQAESPSAQRRLADLLTPRATAATSTTGAAAHSDVWAETLADDPLAQVLGAPNPLLEAARPLLRALAEIPALPLSSGKPGSEVDLDALRQTLVRDMNQFQFLCDRAGFRREQVVTARYCLCTALDEAIYKLPGASSAGSTGSSASSTGSASSSGITGSTGSAGSTDSIGSVGNNRGNWADHSLLLLFHNETSGGEKFFLLLGHMVLTPREHIQVLEVLYHILSLGFEGRYALMMDGTRQLETIHRRLLAIICEQTEPVQPELAPHWRGLSGGRMRFMRTVPVWVTACVFGLLLLALYTSRRSELVPQAEALTRQIEQLTATPFMPVSPVWSDELPLEAWFTAQEQQRFGLQVDVSGQTLRIPGSIAFVNGTELHKDMLQVLDIVAMRLKLSSRSALVLGHTDNTPLRYGSRFRDNQHLSEARAETVVRELIRRGIAAERLQASGKSDTAPLADNATPQGRAQNRRVEITLRLPGTLPPEERETPTQGVTP